MELKFSGEIAFQFLLAFDRDLCSWDFFGLAFEPAVGSERESVLEKEIAGAQCGN